MTRSTVAAPAPATPSGLIRRPAPGLVLVLGALSAFGPLSMDMYLPGLPTITRDLGASTSVGQLTLTGCMLGLAVGQLIAGPLSDSLGRRRPLLSALVAFIATSIACAVAPSIWALIALRVAQGVAGGAGVVIARTIVRDLFTGTTAARVFAWLMMVMGVAPVFGPLIGGQVLRLTSWRGVFVLLGAIGVPLLLGAMFALPEPLRPEDRHAGGLAVTRRNFRRLLGDRSYVPYAASFTLASAAMFAYIAGASFVLEDIHGVSPQVFSVAFAANSVGLITMSQVGGHFVTRVGSDRLLRCGLIGTATGATATVLVTVTGAGLWPLLASLFVVLAGNGLVFPNGNASALAEQRAALGSASALLGLGQFGSGAAVAPLVGIAGAHSAVPMVALIGACGITALAINLLFTRPRAADTRPPPSGYDRGAV